MSPRRPKVVIVGAGFGGLEAAKALNRVAVDVIVIDRQNHHCFQPLLYQVPTAALSPPEIAWPIRHILRQQRNATVLMAQVSGIDLAGQFVHTGAGPISYDYLVIATGATHSYFGHDDWIDFAPGLKRIEDATRIRRSILLAFEQAELAHDDAERQRLLTFVIVGGGATGVEMAGAIAEIARQTLAKDFRRIDPRSSRIILLEAGPRVLPTLPEDLSRYAERTLTRMGVDVRTSTRVTNCDRRGVDLDRGRIDAGTVIWAAGVVASPAARWLGAEHDSAGRVLVRPDLDRRGVDLDRGRIDAGTVIWAAGVVASPAARWLGAEHDSAGRVLVRPDLDRRGVDLDRGRIDAGTVIWAAGVVASPAARWLGAEHDSAGRVLVRPDLSVPNHPEVFVIGDAAAVHDEEGAMVPGVAPAAKQMGRYVGRLIAARVAGISSPRPFRYRPLGELATIGRR